MYTKHPEQFKGNNKGKLDDTRIFTYLHTLELNSRNKLPCNMGLYSMPKCMTLSSGSYVVLKVYKKEYNKTLSSLKDSSSQGRRSFSCWQCMKNEARPFFSIPILKSGVQWVLPQIISFFSN